MPNSLKGKHSLVNEQRIAECSKMMREMTFRRGETYKVLAKKWGVSEEWARAITAAASKRVRKEVSDPDHVVATVGSALETALQECIRSADYKQVANLARVWLDGVGASAPKRTEVQIKEDLPDDINQLAAIVRDEMQRIQVDYDVSVTPELPEHIEEEDE